MVKGSSIIGLKIVWSKATLVSLLLIGFYVVLFGFANPPAEASASQESDQPMGRMTGGGILVCVPPGGPGGAIATNSSSDDNSFLVTHGFELYCDPTDRPNNLQIHFRGKDVEGMFHLEQVFTSSCSEEETIRPGRPRAEIDTLMLTGTGRLNGRSGATVAVTFTDNGEPGKNDVAKFLIADLDGTIVLNCSGKLKGGNHQAHDIQKNRR
jgi:hypothetical protein